MRSLMSLSNTIGDDSKLCFVSMQVIKNQQNPEARMALWENSSVAVVAAAALAGFMIAGFLIAGFTIAGFMIAGFMIGGEGEFEGAKPPQDSQGGFGGGRSPPQQR